MFYLVTLFSDQTIWHGVIRCRDSVGRMSAFEEVSCGYDCSHLHLIEMFVIFIDTLFAVRESVNTWLQFT